MREKFGRFVLLDEIETTGLGTEYRAAKLSASGFERLVAIIRFNPAISATPELAKDVLEHVKQAASLQNPYILKVHGIGKIESNYYISYEFLEARSLKTILARCRQEGFPFSANHTLLIASKVCSALDFAHARKAEDGQRFLHGLLNPAAVMLSNDGEVRTRFFGIGRSRIREGRALGADDLAYLAPEQRGGGPGDASADVYALGAILFECLTGERWNQEGRTDEVAAHIAAARLQDPSVEPRNIPEHIAEILRRSLAESPRDRYAQIEEMRKAIDTLLFSGDFTPTTFNLAFLMHSLFREQLERETALIKQEREASYAEFLVDETPAPQVPRGAPPSPTPAGPPPEARPLPPPAQAARPDPAVSDRTEPYRLDELRPVDTTEPHPRVEAAHHPPIILATSRRSTSWPLIAGAVAVLLAGGLAAFFLTRRAPAPPTPPPLTPEMQAALNKVQELEAKLKTIEEEKAAASAKAAEEARLRIEAQARQRGQAVDPAALRRAQDEAVEQSRQLQERRAADLARELEVQQQAAAVAAAAAAAATPVPTPTPTLPAPTPLATATVEVAQPTVVPTVAPTPEPTAVPTASPIAAATPAVVVPPILQNAPRLNYPPLALRQRVEGTVEVRAFVDAQGVVTETQVLRGVAGKSGLNEAAVDNVRQRRYRPATRTGAPVGTWITVRVEFRLPR